MIAKWHCSAAGEFEHDKHQWAATDDAHENEQHCGSNQEPEGRHCFTTHRRHENDECHNENDDGENKPVSSRLVGGRTTARH